jgi:hypothetical protein
MADSIEVAIGKLVWMIINLNVGKFLNGDPIPKAITYEEWKSAGKIEQLFPQLDFMIC